MKDSNFTSLYFNLEIFNISNLLKNNQTSAYVIRISLFKKTTKAGFPGGTVVENLPANAVDTGSSPGLGRSHMLQSG